MEQFSVMGNRFGSGAQIGLGDYLSQVGLAEGEIIAKMQQDGGSRRGNLPVSTGPVDMTASAAILMQDDGTKRPRRAKTFQRAATSVQHAP